MIIDPNDMVQSRKAFDTWDDLRFPAQAIGRGANAPTWDTTHVGWSFSNNPPNNQEVQLTAQMPHGWREGSSIHIHMHWYLLVAGGVNEDVKWDLLYRIANVGGTFPAGWVVLENTVNVSADGIRDHLVTEWTAVVMTGKTLSCFIDLRVQRDTQDAADDHEQNVILKEVDIHHQREAFGSVEEWAKWG